jgi:hypothetical protein
MHRTRTIVAIILIAAGLVWIGQGLGLIRGGGFMTDDARWAVIGAVCVVVGLVIGWTQVRARRV